MKRLWHIVQIARMSKQSLFSGKNQISIQIECMLFDGIFSTRFYSFSVWINICFHFFLFFLNELYMYQIRYRYGVRQPMWVQSKWITCFLWVTVQSHCHIFLLRTVKLRKLVVYSNCLNSFWKLQSFHIKATMTSHSEPSDLDLHCLHSSILLLWCDHVWVKRLSLSKIVADDNLLTITKTCLFKYIENFTTKIWKFSDEKFWYFSYFCSKHRLWVLVRTASSSAQNIDCGYSLEPPRRGGSNEYPQSIFWAEIRKIMYTPVNPSFTI